jgi:hypothetical protein
VSTLRSATEHSWEARGYYTYTERDESQRLDALQKPREGRGSLPVPCASAVIKLNWLG